MKKKIEFQIEIYIEIERKIQVHPRHTEEKKKYIIIITHTHSFISATKSVLNSKFVSTLKVSVCIILINFFLFFVFS